MEYNMLTAVTRDLDSRKGRFERCFCRRLFIMMIKAELLRSEYIVTTSAQYSSVKIFL